MKVKGFLPAKILLPAVFFSLFFVVAVSAAFLPNAAVSVLDSHSAGNLASDEQRIFDLVNREREKNGLNDLEWRDDLASLARSYSEKMAHDDFFSHYEGDGATVVQRAKAMRIKNWNKIGENLFVCTGYNNYTSLAVRNWMRSPTHRENILDEEWTATGVGLARSDDGKIYMTQVFIKN